MPVAPRRKASRSRAKAPKAAAAAPAVPRLRIAFATPADGPQLGQLLVEMYKENGVGRFSPAKTWGGITDLLENGVVILVKRGDEIVGSVGLKEDGPWYADAQFLRDFWVFVHPKARRSTAFAMLVRATKRISDELGLPAVISVTTPVDLGRKVKALQHYGFHAIGEIMVYGKRSA